MGDGVAQFVEHWTQDPKTQCSNPVRTTRKNCEFFQVKNVMTHCRCAQPLCVLYAHIRMIKYTR